MRYLNTHSILDNEKIVDTRIKIETKININPI